MTASTTDIDFEAEIQPSQASGETKSGPLPSPLRRKAPFLIGVAGGTASGKTSVCKRMMQQLRNDLKDQPLSRYVHLAQDSFYRNLTSEEQASISGFNFDHPSAFAWTEIVATLRDMKAGRPAQIPQYDFVTSSRRPESTAVEPADVILFDGILAFYSAELRELFDLMIFVDVDDDTRLARRIRRDMVERKRDVLHVLEQYERTVKPSFSQFILPTKQHAHIIVPRGLENTVAIDLITEHIKWRLAERLQSNSTAA